jgi:hypothetical protein
LILFFVSICCVPPNIFSDASTTLWLLITTTNTFYSGFCTLSALAVMGIDGGSSLKLKVAHASAALRLLRTTLKL